MADVKYFDDLNPLTPTPGTDDGKLLAGQSSPPNPGGGYKPTFLGYKNYVNNGQTGGKTIHGGTATTETLTLRNNSIDDLGFEILDDGVLRSNVSNYETLLVDDDDIPNKKYVDDQIIAVGGLEVEDLTTQLAGGGVTAFTLSNTPVSPAKSILVYNGQVQIYGVNYTISGTTVTWITTPPSFVLGSNDGVNSLIIYYDITIASSTPTAFRAYVNSDHIGVTGDGTAYIILFQAEDYDYQNRYNPATGQYTAAFDQIFHCSANFLLGGTISASHEILGAFIHRNSGGTVLNTSNFYLTTPSAILSASAQIIFSGSADFELSTGDTVEAYVSGTGGAKTIDVINTSSRFYGHVVTAV